MVSNNIMNSQINVCLNQTLLSYAKNYAKKHGYSTIQNLIKTSLRDKVFEEKQLTNEEALLISKLIEVSESKNLFSSE